jgi:mRNA interferase MazF
MREGDVIIIPMPQADGAIKNRPAIILREMPPFRDVLVCGLSTQLNQATEGFDELITPDDDDFGLSDLQAESLIRLGFLAVIPRTRIVGSIGSITSERHKRLLERLSKYLLP